MLPIPKHALEIIKTIRNAGFEAYAVGGCVRDALLGNTAADVDVTTSASSEVILSLFPDSMLTGGRFMTVTVLYAGGKAEITPYRSESGYSDSRRPDNVTEASGLTEDLKRRDFTINALCFDGEKVIDLLGGISDLELRIIRCVGDPERRFDEDALRIMRAFRFSAELGFEIEPETMRAALAASEKLKRISVERIRDELIKTLLSPSPERISPLLETSALSFLGINNSPQIANLKSLVKNETVRLAAFFYICGRGAANTMKLPTRQKRVINGVFSVLDSLPPPAENAVKRAISRSSPETFEIAAEIAEKLYDSAGDYSSILRRITESGEPYRVSDLAVNGSDLIESGIRETDVGRTLERLLETVIDHPELNTRETLLNIIRKRNK